MLKLKNKIEYLRIIRDNKYGKLPKDFQEEIKHNISKRVGPPCSVIETYEFRNTTHLDFKELIDEKLVNECILTWETSNNISNIFSLTLMGKKILQEYEESLINKLNVWLQDNILIISFLTLVFTLMSLIITLFK